MLKREFSLLLFFCLVLSTAVNSQSFNAGFLAGVNASHASGDGYSGFHKAGLFVGLFSNVDLSTKVNLQMEINYTQKGSRKNPFTSEGDNDFFLMRLNYIEIPVLVRTHYKRFIFEGGGYYGQLVNSYLEDENGPFDIPEQLNQFHNYDVGISVGIYFKFTESLLMNWRFSNSVLAFREYDSGANFRFDNGMFHHVMSVNVRYVFYGEQ